MTALASVEEIRARVENSKRSRAVPGDIETASRLIADLRKDRAALLQHVAARDETIGHMAWQIQSLAAEINKRDARIAALEASVKENANLFHESMDLVESMLGANTIKCIYCNHEYAAAKGTHQQAARDHVAECSAHPQRKVEDALKLRDVTIAKLAAALRRLCGKIESRKLPTLHEEIEWEAEDARKALSSIGMGDETNG